MAAFHEIELAFGKNANLYTDVLHVSQNANIDQLLQAYLKKWQDTKNEMNQATNHQDKEAVKIKLEALHSTYRTLCNSDLRGMYDEMLNEINGTGHSNLSNVSGPALEGFRAKLTMSNVGKNNKVFKRQNVRREVPIGSPRSARDVDESFEVSYEEYIEEDSLYSHDDTFDTLDTYDTLDTTITNTTMENHVTLSNPVLRCVPVDHQISLQRKMKRIMKEIQGTKTDTLNAFDQVWNVFSLQAEEVDKLCGVIEKEKENFRHVDEFYEIVQRRLTVKKNFTKNKEILRKRRNRK